MNTHTVLRIENNILAQARTACYNEKVIDVTFLLQAFSRLQAMSCKSIGRHLNEGSKFLWQVWTLDSSIFWGGGCKILWDLLTHLEAFLSKDFLVEEHTAKCVISDTSPVPSSAGLNLCSLSCIPLCRDTKKIMSYFSFISPHTPFSFMH